MLDQTHFHQCLQHTLRFCYFSLMGTIWIPSLHSRQYFDLKGFRHHLSVLPDSRKTRMLILYHKQSAFQPCHQTAQWFILKSQGPIQFLLGSHYVHFPSNQTVWKALASLPSWFQHRCLRLRLSICYPVHPHGFFEFQLWYLLCLP